MNKLLRGVALVAAIPVMVVAAGGHAEFVLFSGSFDNSVATLSAEVGKFFAWTSDTSVVTITNDASGGNYLVIDDTSQPVPQSVVVAGGFAGYKQVVAGYFKWTYEITLGNSDAPFTAGMVVDNPASDFIPATGSSGGGYLSVVGKKSNFALPQGVPLDYTVELSRDDPDDDWAFTISVVERSPNAGSPEVNSGLLRGTGGRNLIGFAFEKDASIAGRVTIDNVSAVTNYPVTGGY